MTSQRQKTAHEELGDVATTIDKTQDFPFMHLPTEIRNNIYRHLADAIVLIMPLVKPEHNPKVPALLLTSKQTAIEFRGILLDRAQIVVRLNSYSDFMRLTEFLNRLPRYDLLCLRGRTRCQYRNDLLICLSQYEIARNVDAQSDISDESKSEIESCTDSDIGEDDASSYDSQGSEIVHERSDDYAVKWANEELSQNIAWCYCLEVNYDLDWAAEQIIDDADDQSGHLIMQYGEHLHDVHVQTLIIRLVRMFFSVSRRLYYDWVWEPAFGECFDDTELARWIKSLPLSEGQIKHGEESLWPDSVDLSQV